MGYALLEYDLYVETCWVCGIQFSMPKVIQHKRTENGKTFWCPNGDRLSYGDGECNILKKQLEREKTRREWAEKNAKTARHSEAIARGKLKASKRRAATGVE